MRLFLIILTFTFHQFLQAQLSQAEQQLQPVDIENQQWKIIGEDDFVAINRSASNIPKPYRKLINAVGRLNLGCTATHIGNGIVLTAGHCFFALANLVQDSECDDVEIEWGVRQGLRLRPKSKCEKILYMKNDLVRHDFAILKVSPVPKAQISVDLSREVQVGDRVSVFSHPDDLPMRWSNFCQIHEKAYPQLPRESLMHDCDTKVGSSGAALIDANTLKIVGLHGGGRLVDEKNGMNYATPLTDSDLQKALQELGF